MEPEAIVGGMRVRVGAGVPTGWDGSGVEIVMEGEGEATGVTERGGMGVETALAVQAVNPKPATKVTITAVIGAILNLNLGIYYSPKMVERGKIEQRALIYPSLQKKLPHARSDLLWLP